MDKDIKKLDRWKIFNGGKELEIKVDGIKCVILEDLLDEQVEIFKNTDKHLLNINIDTQKYHSDKRRLKFVEKCKNSKLKWNCVQYGYFVLVNSDKIIEEINIDVEGLGWSETEDIMVNLENNKEEIEFVQKILKSIEI